jgi:glycosyltransferase involved in cell wall biosynthesis
MTAMMGTTPAMTQRKLIIITHEFAPFRGGVAIYAEELARAILRTGAGVMVWAPDYGVRNAECGTRSEEREDMGVRVVRLRAGGSLRFGDVFQFAGELSARREQLIDSTVVLASVGAHLAWMLLEWAGLIGCDRVVSVLHGSEVLRFERNPFWRWLARIHFRRASGVVTVSAFSRSLIEKSFLGRMVGKVDLAPGACSSAAARETAISRPEDGRVRIFTLARIHPRKGQLETARALGMLPAELRAKIIYQVGGTGDANHLRQIVSACAEGGVPFEYLGAIAPDKLAEAYAGCDVFAMTSRSLARSVEGFGIAYLESGFHGKPVVAYRSGGTAEAVLDGESGFLVAEGDVKALAEAFARLICDPDLRARLGAGGRRHAAKFSWDSTARVVLDVCFGN